MYEYVTVEHQLNLIISTLPLPGLNIYQNSKKVRTFK